MLTTHTHTQEIINVAFTPFQTLALQCVNVYELLATAIVANSTYTRIQKKNPNVNNKRFVNTRTPIESYQTILL